MGCHWKKVFVILPFVFFIGIAIASSIGFAQRTPEAKSNNEQKDEDEVAPPTTVTLTTKDQVSLAATYFEGPKSKNTPAIILVHDWARDRKDTKLLASYLQEEWQCSVITPDLRGHGESVSVVGMDKKLDYRDFKKADVMSVGMDIEACKKHLMGKNNAGELNIEMLALITVGGTSVQGVQWCVDDWNWPMAPGGRKQGQDVKLLVTIGPSRRLEGCSLNQMLKKPLMTGKMMEPLPVQIVWGRNHEDSEKEATAIYELLNKSRKKLKKSQLRMSHLRSPAGPTELINSNATTEVVFKAIGNAINAKIISNKDVLVWQNRGKRN